MINEAQINSWTQHKEKDLNDDDHKLSLYVSDILWTLISEINRIKEIYLMHDD